LKIQERIEKYYAKNIETMLTPIVGAGNVVARVSVEIDTTAQTFLEEKFNPDGQVVRSQTSEEDKLQSTEGKAQEGGVGAAANIPAATGTADGNETQVLSQTDETRKSKTTQYEINRSLLETVQSPGGIAKKQASVFIAPRGGDLPARTAQELEDLRITVANALGINLSEADGDPLKMDNMVVVKEMAFTQPASVVGGMNAFDDFMFKYGQYVKNIIAVIIIFGLVFFFSRMLKKLKPKNEDVEIMDELSAGNRGKIESNLTPELLNDLIQEKPENVSTALKTWMEQGNN
jgi:flagellar M-ring protein FliF